MNNTEIAKKVIEALGGRENVNSVAHCATRLRVMVKDEGKIDKNTVENLEKVQGAFFNSGQYQIIFGTGTVNKIYDEVVALGLPTSSKDDMKAEAAKQGNWFQRAIRTFGDVFVPIIPVIVATGLFMGVRGLLNALGMTLPIQKSLRIQPSSSYQAWLFGQPSAYLVEIQLLVSSLV